MDLDGILTDGELLVLVDTLRGAARTGLGSNTLVLSDENIIELLPPGVSLADCTEATCEVDLGRRLGANIIISAQALRIDDAPSVSVKLHDATSGSLVGQRVFGGSTYGELVDELAALAPRWLGHAMGGISNSSVVSPDFAAANPEDLACEAQEGSCLVIDGAQAGSVSVTGRSGGTGQFDYCPGFFASEADHIVELLSPAASLHFRVVRADGDTTLRVEGAGSVECNDDDSGQNPAITVDRAEAGLYRVWVGSFGRSNYSYSLELEVQ